MTPLLIANFKLIVLALWIGSMVGLTKLGSITKDKRANA